MTRCSLDLEKRADGWNAMSADLSAYSWREIFTGKEATPARDPESPEDEIKGLGAAPEGPLPLPLQDSVTVSALKDLAK